MHAQHRAGQQYANPVYVAVSLSADQASRGRSRCYWRTAIPDLIYIKVGKYI